MSLTEAELADEAAANLDPKVADLPIRIVVDLTVPGALLRSGRVAPGQLSDLMFQVGQIIAAAVPSDVKFDITQETTGGATVTGSAAPA